MSDKDKDALKDAKKEFVGKAIVEFIVGTKKPKKYKLGDEFKTKNEAVFNDLISKNKIR